MASPQQRPDPNEPRRDYEDLQRARMERRSAAGAGFAWWWFFWIIILGLAIWWAGWGWGGSGGWWWGGRARTAPAYGTTNPGPGTNNGMAGNAGRAASRPTVTRQIPLPQISGTGLKILTATDRHPFVGRNFQVSTVPVVGTVNSQAVWVGTRTTPPMLLILGSGAVPPNTHIVAGSLLDVTGTVEKAPPAAQARSQWNLGDKAGSQLEKQGVYIQATRVYAIQSPQAQ